VHRPSRTTRRAAALAATLLLAACASAARQPSPSAAPLSPAEQARADSGRPPYTRADVEFMQGMIAHHAQAIRMARMAPTHGASAGLRTLAERIEVSQQDEIAFMQRWLRDRRETVPDPLALGGHAGHDTHQMPGMQMPGMQTSGGLMPGMLTPEQMAALDAARGEEFDRLFLADMIQHHQGALTMVDRLFAVPGAGQEGTVFRFASDVTADQTTEIDRMRAMLAARGGS
jgi:uncharacterized protein (DUF305 family)